MRNVQPHPQPTPRSPPREYRVYHDPDGNARLSTTLVHALADAMGEDVTDAGVALSRCIDVEALDHIFAGDGGERLVSGSHLAFAADGYRVTVYGTGHIVITPPDAPRRPSGHA